MLNKLDQRTFDKLRKVWSLRGSSHAGEIASAEAAALRIVKPFGYSLDDVPHLLGIETEAERRRRLWKSTRQPPTERQEAVMRYGGIEKVRAFTDRERLLRASVAKWSVYQKPPRADRIASIDGCDWFPSKKASARVLQAISKAYPLPATVTDAAAEYEYWSQRRRHLELIAEYEEEDYLDMPARIRWGIVTELLENGIRANSVAEILIRFRYPGATGFRMTDEVEQGVLLDLEHFAALEAKGTVQNGHGAGHEPVIGRTTSERRQAVIDLMSNLDTLNLSDREIARRVGVSPQTVGNIRRRMAG